MRLPAARGLTVTGSKRTTYRAIWPKMSPKVFSSGLLEHALLSDDTFTPLVAFPGTRSASHVWGCPGLAFLRQRSRFYAPVCRERARSGEV